MQFLTRSGNLKTTEIFLKSPCRICQLSRLISNVQTEKKRPKMPNFVIQKKNQLQSDLVSEFSTNPARSLFPEEDATGLNNEDSSQFSMNFDQIASSYFERGGKMFRPVIAILMAAACKEAVALQSSRFSPRYSSLENLEISEDQFKIGKIAEMIHTASLIHDDVIDESDQRRGQGTINAVYGNKMAVLVGDYILARATQILCSIGRPNVISVMASIIEDLVLGEFMQMESLNRQNLLDDYLKRIYKKTASLFANSCKSVAVLAEGDISLQKCAFEYGRNLGIAFQIIDDILDFVATSENLGKPIANDLKLGISTCPIIYAAEQYPELYVLMARKFKEPGDSRRAQQIVLNSEGLEKSRELAKFYSAEAAKLAATLPNSNGIADSLLEIALAQLDRTS